MTAVTAVTAPTAATNADAPHLRKTLGPLMLWGLGVGYVISGEYFGWNLGLKEGGTYGMLAATLLVSVMYVAFVLSYAELACALPKAGGAFVYATRALGPEAGFFAGLFQLIEFVFAPPAIALAIGAYLHVYFQSVSPVTFAIGVYAVFTALNVWGVKQAATFELLVTVIAVAELIVFMGVTAPHFEWRHFHDDPLPNGWTGALAAIPFAIWFYLAIEGVANAAEEAKNPQRDVALGFTSAIVTLVVLALGVFTCAVGVAGWKAAVYASPGAEPSDSPLPLTMAHAVAPDSVLYTSLLAIGIFGLLASFHGILLAAGRATMALGEARLLPRVLGRVHPRFETPAAALLANMVVGVIAVLTGKTAQIITLACFGALCLYIVSMIALFALRKREPELPRPFRAVGYPVVPAVALALAVLCLAAMTVYNLALAAVFVALVLVARLAERVRLP